MLSEELRPFERPLRALYDAASETLDGRSDAAINRDRALGRLIFARRVTDPHNKPYRISIIRDNTIWGIDIETLEIQKINLDDGKDN